MIYVGLVLGTLIGVIITNFRLQEEKNINKILRKTISNIEDDLDSTNFRVEQRDNLIKNLKNENTASLEFEKEVINIMNNSGTIVNKYDKIKELVNDMENAD